MLRKGPTSLLEVGPFVYSLKILSVITDKILILTLFLRYNPEFDSKTAKNPLDRLK